MEEKETATIEFKVDAQDYETINNLAAQENKTVEEILLEFLEAYCKGIKHFKDFEEFEAKYELNIKLGVV